MIIPKSSIKQFFKSIFIQNSHPFHVLFPQHFFFDMHKIVFHVTKLRENRHDSVRNWPVIGYPIRMAHETTRKLRKSLCLLYKAA